MIMGGFQRYPWPQYINNAPFYWNKKWKWASVFATFCGVVNYMIFHRYARSHLYWSPGYGSYIDPSQHSAPISPNIY